MNPIDTLFAHLNYDESRRVLLINADDFRRPGDLAFLNIHNDIVIIVGVLQRLHRWKGVHYPQAEIFRFFVEESEQCQVSTSSALAAQGILLAQKMPSLKSMPWLVLSGESETILTTLRSAGIKKCQSCKLQRPEKTTSVYRDIPKNIEAHSADDRTPRPPVSQRVLGGKIEKKLPGFKHSYPDQLTEAGEQINELVVSHGGGFPITLVKLSKLIEEYSGCLSQESIALFQQHRERCRVSSRAVQRLVKQNGFQVQGSHVMGALAV